MKQLNEDFQTLHELLGKVKSLISPITYHDDMKWLMDRKNIGKFKETYPKCVIPLNIGRKNYVMPVCNRMGSMDKDMINLSLKMVIKLMNKEENEEFRGEIDIVKIKLERLLNKYSQDIPKPADMAAKKAIATKLLNKIKAYNDAIKGM